MYNPGDLHNRTSTSTYGVRPSINLKSTVEIVDGEGTENNPYRLKGDKDVPMSGTLLNTRYSGEYVRFGNGENNLYRIVSKENGGVKLTSAKSLKNNGSFITKKFNTSNQKVIYTPADATYELA